MPGLAPTSTSRAHPLGGRERNMQGDAPAQRVAAQREALRARREHLLSAAHEGDRPRRVRALAVAREVERERAVAFRVEQPDHAVPRAAGAAEAMQQDDVLGHPAIL